MGSVVQPTPSISVGIPKVPGEEGVEEAPRESQTEIAEVAQNFFQATLKGSPNNLDEGWDLPGDPEDPQTEWEEAQRYGEYLTRALEYNEFWNGMANRSSP